MSLMSVDKNDVNISALFGFQHTFEIEVPGRNIKMTFYQRLVSDQFINIARATALRESNKLRTNLRDLNWESREDYIPPLRDEPKDKVVEVIAGFSSRELARQAVQRVQDELKIPNEPDGEADLADREAYQVEVDEYENKYAELIQKYVKELIEARREELNKLTQEELVDAYERVLLAEHCEQRYARVFKETTTYYGTYLDEEYTERVAGTLKDFMELPSSFKDLLMTKYSELEIDVPTLKK